MDDELKFMAGFLGLLVVVAIALIVVLSVVMAFWGAASCDAAWGPMQHEWSFFGGCRVLTEDGWVPADNLRIVFDEVTVVAE